MLVPILFGGAALLLLLSGVARARPPHPEEVNPEVGDVLEFSHDDYYLLGQRQEVPGLWYVVAYEDAPPDGQPVLAYWHRADGETRWAEYLTDDQRALRQAVRSLRIGGAPAL